MPFRVIQYYMSGTPGNYHYLLLPHLLIHNNPIKEFVLNAVYTGKHEMFLKQSSNHVTHIKYFIFAIYSTNFLIAL